MGNPAARTVIGGLITSTLLMRIALVVLYFLQDDPAVKWKRKSE